MEAAILKNSEITKLKKKKTLFISKLMDTHTHLTHVVFVCYAKISLLGYFIKFVPFIRHNWEKNQYLL